MRILIPLFCLIVAGGLYFTYISPALARIDVLEAENQELDQALTKAKELQAIRDQLLARFNTFREEDLKRLQKLVPDHIDNVRLIMDIDGIASRHNMKIREFSFSADADAAEGVPAANAANTSDVYGTMGLSISLHARYDDFVAFLRDLERSLRLVDVGLITIGEGDGGRHTFTIELSTYWLR